MLRPVLALAGLAAAVAAMSAAPAASEASCPAGPNGKPCAGQGACVNGTCQCDGRFLAPDCIKQGCPHGCSGNGKCDTASGTCKCEVGFMGDDCADAVPPCPKSGAGDECGGNGVCEAATGKCTCNDRWGGKSCTEPLCDPLCVAGGHGGCNKGKCACDDGFRGDVCQSKTCPGMVRRRRAPMDRPDEHGDVGVSASDDARRKAKIAAVVAQTAAPVTSAPAAEVDEEGDGQPPRFRADSALSEAGFANDVDGAVSAALGIRSASFLQESGSPSDETARAILAAAGSLDQDPLQAADASAEDAAAVQKEAANDAKPDADTPVPPAALAEGLSLWRFRSLRTKAGSEVPDADNEAALRSALGLAGDDSALARAVEEADGASSHRLAAREGGGKAVDKPEGEEKEEPAAAASPPRDDEVAEWVTEYCSGNGECAGDGTCKCDEGFTGADCAQRTCPADCSGNGDCDSAKGKCTCRDGFYGPDCASRFCPGRVNLGDPDLPEVPCTGHGECDASSGKCACRQPWLGEACAERRCPGRLPAPADDPLNRTHLECNGRGSCHQAPTPGTCMCEEGWTGAACATPACGPEQCGAEAGHGKCTGDEDNAVCMCAPGYTGPQCGEALCPGPGGGCSGHGTCDSLTGVCACEGAWSGGDCSLPAVVHGVVVGRRYPVSMYEHLRAGERNRAAVVAELARESAAETAARLTAKRVAQATKDSKSGTIADALTHGADGSDVAEGSVAAALTHGAEDKEAFLQERAERRRTAVNRGGAVLSAEEDDAKAEAEAEKEVEKEDAEAEKEDAEEADKEDAADAEAETAPDAKKEESDAKAQDAKSDDTKDDVPKGAADPTVDLVTSKAARLIASAKKAAQPPGLRSAEDAVEFEEAGGDPAEAKASVGVHSTIADALHVTHHRATLRRKAGLLRDPEAVTTDTAAAGGGPDDGIVFLTRCDPGWTGPTCSERVSSFRCNGGAGCGDHGNCTRYGCLCDRGWSGYDCSVPAASISCPVGVPMEADGYYRRAAQLHQAEEERTRKAAAEYQAAKRLARGEAEEALEEEERKDSAKRKAALAGDLAAEEADAEVAADEATAALLQRRAGHRLRHKARSTASAEGLPTDPAKVQAALKALASLREMQNRMRNTHSYMHGRGVGVPCSGRGVCGTDGHCVCNDGYGGLACEKRVVAHGVCTPRERDPAEEDRLEREQVEREAAAAEGVRAARVAAEKAAEGETMLDQAAADESSRGAADGPAARAALLKREMNDALDQAAKHRAQSLGRPAMLPPPELECICGTVPDEKAAFPGQMYRGPGCDKRTCPSGCSGHGTCTDNGACLCRGGWTGNDCAQAACPRSCGYRGSCTVTVALEHTIAGALVGSHRVRDRSAEEMEIARERKEAAQEGDEGPEPETKPASLAAAVSGVEGLRRAAQALGMEGRKTLGAAISHGAKQQPQDNSPGAIAAQGGRAPSSVEVAQAVEDLIKNAVSANEAAAYSEEGAAAAADAAASDPIEEAEAERQAEQEEAGNTEPQDEDAALLQRVAQRATHRARARAKAQAKAKAQARQDEDEEAPKDEVSQLASSIEKVEAASKRAEAAAEAAQKAAEEAKGSAAKPGVDGEEASDASAPEEESADGETAEENSGDAAEEEAAEEESGDAAEEDSADAAEEDSADAAEEDSADAAEEDSADAAEEDSADAAEEDSADAAEEDSADAAEEDSADAALSLKKRHMASVILGDGVPGEAPPTGVVARRKWRLKKALEMGADPFSLGFPVQAMCKCDQGWGGEACETRVCPNGCSGHGTCDKATQVCLCAKGWSGPACGTKAPLGCPDNCGGPKHGRCVGGKCFCRHPYFGAKCQRQACPDSCNGNGACFDGKCKCSPGWSGVTCAAKACPKGCSKHGDCDSTTKECHCHAGYGGEDCSVKTFEQKATPAASPSPTPKPEPSPEPSASPMPGNETGFVSLERPTHSIFGGTDVLMVLG